MLPQSYCACLRLRKTWKNGRVLVRRLSCGRRVVWQYSSPDSHSQEQCECCEASPGSRR